MSCAGCNATPEECVHCGGEGGDVATAVLAEMPPVVPVTPIVPMVPSSPVSPQTTPQPTPTPAAVAAASGVVNDHLGCKPSAGPTVSEDGNLHSKHFTSTRNACKLCTPLGACLVFRGVEGCIPFLHGSQGCSTYIRRYMIGHFREPIDIASSSF